MGRLFTNSSGFLSGLMDSEVVLKKKFGKKMEAACKMMHEGVTKRTPVHTGTALASYVWSTSKSGDGGMGRVTTFPPVAEATNMLPLGVESRRAAAQAVADASFASISFADPYLSFYLTNSAPHIKGLEYGRYPLPPLRQRSPSGMFRVTLASVIARLQSGSL